MLLRDVRVHVAELTAMRVENIRRASRLAARLLVVALLGRNLGAQAAAVVGSLSGDRARLARITGDTAFHSSSPEIPWMTRLPETRITRLLAKAPITFVRPDLSLAWNSALPLSINDGPMWAGRGWNMALSAGISARATVPVIGGSIRIAFVPTALLSENLPFEVLPGRTPGLSAYSNPIHGADSPIDLPIRFGDSPIARWDLGRSEAEYRNESVSLGATSANESWGPGIRNPLVMSTNAPGIPRLFLRTVAPIKTRYGALGVRLTTGVLTKSPFYAPGSPGYRSFSGMLLTLTPSPDSAFEIGLARAVYAPIGPTFKGAVDHAVDAIWHWEWQRTPADTNAAGETLQRADQITSVFARWIVPESGLEIYGEWARQEMPRSITELIMAPLHTGGYTLGFQWARRQGSGHYLRAQAEVTNVEQTQVIAGRPTVDFYIGRATEFGYTQRGQIVGAATGPGGSSQWFAGDYVTHRWHAGAFVGRIRWENDALYREPLANVWRHDVTVFGGVRGAWRSGLTDIGVDATIGYRYNYLFQNGQANPGGYRTVDVRNYTVTMRFTPR